MNFSIIPVHTGNKAKTYTISFEGSELSEYHRFIFENMTSNSAATLEINEKLKNMVKTHGLIKEFFKRESSEKNNIYRITNTDDLRLYCIKFSNVAIILGSGGIKLPGTVKLEENPHLQIIVDQLIIIEDLIFNRIKSKEIRITNDSIEGNLDFTIEDKK